MHYEPNRKRVRQLHCFAIVGELLPTRRADHVVARVWGRDGAHHGEELVHKCGFWCGCCSSPDSDGLANVILYSWLGEMKLVNAISKRVRLGFVVLELYLPLCPFAVEPDDLENHSETSRSVTSNFHPEGLR